MNAQYVKPTNPFLILDYGYLDAVCSISVPSLSVVIRTIGNMHVYKCLWMVLTYFKRGASKASSSKLDTLDAIGRVVTAHIGKPIVWCETLLVSCRMMPNSLLCSGPSVGPLRTIHASYLYCFVWILPFRT